MSGSDLDTIFRPVPRTGVIYVMAEARKRGFVYGAADWANLGQGAPETGEIPNCAPRVTQIELDAARCEYAPVAGLPDLREAVAALYNHRYRKGKRSQYTAANVAIAAGGRTALTRLATVLGPVHLGHLLPDYTAYEELLSAVGRFVPIPVPLRKEDGFRLDPAHLREVAVSTGLGALLLSNPANPTGRVMAGGDLAALVATSRELSCALIMDEFYAHYVYGGSPGQSVSAAEFVDDVDEDPVVIVDGLTKNWRYPGWRLSWTVGPRAVIERVASAGSFLDGGAPHAPQQAALPLLTPEVAEQEARAIQIHFAAKRKLVRTRLAELGIPTVGECEGSFYCFADIGGLPESIRDGMDFFRACLERKVVCVPGVFFDIDPGQRRRHIDSRLRHYVRISYGPAVDELERGLERIEALVSEARAAAP